MTALNAAATATLLTIVKILIGVLILAVIYIITKINYFRRQEQNIEKQRSGIEVALTQRYDTLKKLNTVVSGFAKHETDVLTNVTAMRTGMTPAELAKADAEMTNAVAGLSVLVENYPDIKSNVNFLQFQETINDIEYTLQATRRLYNESVEDYNRAVVSFPSSIIANKVHATTKEFFKAEEHKKQDYEITF